MPRNKMKAISDKLGLPFLDVLKEMYLKNKFSSQVISDKLFKSTGIQITARSIQRELKRNKLVRTLSEAFNLTLFEERRL